MRSGYLGIASPNEDVDTHNLAFSHSILDPVFQPSVMALSAGGVDLVVCCTVFSVLAIIAVALRVWARSLKKSRLQLTDYLIIIGLVRILSPISNSHHKANFTNRC